MPKVQHPSLSGLRGRIAHLERMKDAKPGDRVYVVLSGWTGTIERIGLANKDVRVRWDNPRTCETGRMALVNLDFLED